MISASQIERPAGKSIIIAVGLASLLIGTAFTLRLSPARAGALVDARDTLSSAAPGDIVTHVIRYTDSTSTLAGQSIRITFDPVTNRFDNIGGVVFGDITFSGATLVALCTLGPTDEVQLTTSTAAGDESVIFTVCSSDSLPTSTKTITITNRISNPTTTGSYVVRIGGTQADTLDTRVGIIDRILLSADVAANFTFTITGVASGTTINGVTTTYDSGSTTLAFGTLPINIPVTLGQSLAVISNARNGFVVAVHDDQPLSDGSGSTIDHFPNGAPTSTPVVWYAPSSTPGQQATYGHFGLTTDDSDLEGGAFVASKFVGDIQANWPTPRVIFSHGGPADGVTQDKGVASVAYRVQISPLQEAGLDYSNNLFYVATPVF